GHDCHIKINEIMVNYGTFSTVEITFDAVALINFWRIRGSTKLTINALLDLNFGMLQSYRITRSSIIKISVAEIPDMPEKWSDVFSLYSLVQGGKMLFNTAFPAVRVGVDLVFSGYQLYELADKAYRQAIQLYSQRDQELRIS